MSSWPIVSTKQFAYSLLLPLAHPVFPFALSSAMTPDPCEDRVLYRCPIWAEHSAISYCLYLDTLWVSTSVVI